MATDLKLPALDAIRDYLRLVIDPEPSGRAFNATSAASIKLPTADDMMRSLCAMRPDRPRERNDATDALLFGISKRAIVPTAGFRIVEDPHMTDTVEDWSDVRSPSRAARRRRQGHRQRIRWFERPKPYIYHVGDMLVMHPETARIFRAKVAAAGDALTKRFERDILNTICGGRP